MCVCVSPCVFLVEGWCLDTHLISSHLISGPPDSVLTIARWSVNGGNVMPPHRRPWPWCNTPDLFIRF